MHETLVFFLEAQESNRSANRLPKFPHLSATAADTFQTWTGKVILFSHLVNEYRAVPKEAKGCLMFVPGTVLLCLQEGPPFIRALHKVEPKKGRRNRVQKQTHNPVTVPNRSSKILEVLRQVAANTCSPFHSSLQVEMSRISQSSWSSTWSALMVVCVVVAAASAIFHIPAASASPVPGKSRPTRYQLTYPSCCCLLA